MPAAAAAKSLQSCPTLCDPIDGSPPGSPVPGILQAEHWSGLPFPSPYARGWGNLCGCFWRPLVVRRETAGQRNGLRGSGTG